MKWANFVASSSKNDQAEPTNATFTDEGCLKPLSLRVRDFDIALTKRKARSTGLSRLIIPLRAGHAGGHPGS